MLSQLPLRCQCGKVRGVACQVSPSHGNRIVCYCDDCQAFARFLKRPDVLDAAGGTDIYQMAPCQVRITDGKDALRCLRLTQKGLLRWYTECCHTPVGNTISGSVPFIGVVHSFMDHEGDGCARDQVMGEPVAFVHSRYATGPVPPQAHPKVSLRTLARAVGMLLKWWVTGAGSPSPLFDARTRAPISEPYVLSPAERDALR